jgi:hypothetical protein
MWVTTRFQYSGQTIVGQVTAQCIQGDLISIDNLVKIEDGSVLSGGEFTYGSEMPTNIPSATLSIIQIQ